MTGKSRAERAAALEEFADNVEPQDLTTADTESLRAIAELAERRDAIDDELLEAIRAARRRSCTHRDFAWRASSPRLRTPTSMYPTTES